MYFLLTEWIKQTEQATLAADVINEQRGLQVEYRKLVESCGFNNDLTQNFSLCNKIWTLNSHVSDERRDNRVFWELLSNCTGPFSC